MIAIKKSCKIFPSKSLSTCRQSSDREQKESEKSTPLGFWNSNQFIRSKTFHQFLVEILWIDFAVQLILTQFNYLVRLCILSRGNNHFIHNSTYTVDKFGTRWCSAARLFHPSTSTGNASCMPQCWDEVIVQSAKMPTQRRATMPTKQNDLYRIKQLKTITERQLQFGRLSFRFLTAVVVWCPSQFLLRRHIINRSQQPRFECDCRNQFINLRGKRQKRLAFDRDGIWLIDKCVIDDTFRDFFVFQCDSWTNWIDSIWEKGHKLS